MARTEHLAQPAGTDRLPLREADRLRVREAHDRSWAAWQGAVRRVDAAVSAAVIRPVRVRSSDPERSSPLPGSVGREKIQRELFDD